MPGRVPVRAGLFEDAPSPRLLGSRCRQCSGHHFPRHQSCPYCASTDVAPVELSATGELWAFTAVTAPPPGYKGEVPYGFGVVQLPEGVRVITRLTEPDPSRLSLGDRMELVVEHLYTSEDGDDVVTYAFSPASAPARRPA